MYFKDFSSKKAIKIPIKQIIITLLFIFVFSSQSFAAINAIWPLPNWHSISTHHCEQNSYGTHNGIDIDGQKDLNSPVKAICDGTVIYNHTSRSDIWNAFLVIKHNCDGHTVYGYYGHLNQNNISNTVTKNQTIGTLRNWILSNGHDNTHLHFSASTSLQTNQWGYRPCGTGTFFDPLTYFSFGESTDFSVFDFRRRSDPIYESNQDGTINFDAQFKVRNDGSSSKRIDNMAIDLINQNGTRFAMWVKGSPKTLSPGETYSTGIHYAELWYNGNWAVEARLQVDGEWSTPVNGRREFQVLDSDSGGSDPPGGGNGDADISIDKVEIKKTGESDSHFRHSFTVTSGNNNKLNIEAKVKNKKGDDVYADIYYYWDDDKHFSYKSSHKLGDDTHVKIDGHDDVKKHLGNVHIPDEPGSHYFYIYVKAPGDTDKSSTSNHDEYGKVTVLPQTHPDLVVQSPTVSNASLSPGQAFSMSAVVKNQGNGSSPSTTLRYYRSTNPNISRSDTQLATDSVSSLSANATSSESATISAPTMPGTYWIGACVDEVNEESDKGNNCSSGIVITVNNPTHPDLVVQSPSVSNSTLTPGQSFTVYATVKNQGNGSSSATTLRYYRSTNSTISINDTEIGTDSVSALSAGSSSSEDKGNRVAPSTPGTYWVGACVDSVSGESNTGNNCSAGVQITVTNQTHPDLIVQSPSVSNSTLTPGQSFTVYATVKNQGNGSSSTTTLRYYRSTNATINTSDTLLGTDFVPALSSNGTSSENISFSAPSSSGTYWIGACVDTVSGESNTGNNCSAGVQITVNTAPPQQDSYEPDNSSNSASIILLNETQSHSIVPADDIDWVRFILPSNQCVNIKTMGVAGDTRLWLFDQNLNQIAFNDDTNGLFSQITSDNLVTGTYYVKIDEYNNDNEISSYQLALTSCHPDAEFPWNMFFPAILGKSSRCVVDADENHTYSGSWSSDCLSMHRSGSYAKYYKFTLHTTKTLIIDLQSNQDTYLILLRGSGKNGSMLTENDDANNSLNSQIVRSLSPGTYTVEATTYSQATSGGFTLTIH